MFSFAKIPPMMIMAVFFIQLSPLARLTETQGALGDNWDAHLLNSNLNYILPLTPA